MAGKVCGGMYYDLLSQYLAGGGGGSLILHLYENNYTPVLDENPANFTEASIAGYAALSLSPGSWTVNNSSGIVTATYPQQTFTFTGSGTIYGYYVTNPFGAVVLWAELASSGPFVYGGGGGLLFVSLELDGPTS